MRLVPFLLDIVPASFIGAFAQGNMLQMVFVSVFCGVSIVMMGEKAAPLTQMLDAALEMIYGVIRIVMWTAPIGAFGAIAFGVGKFGIASTIALAKFIGDFYVTCAIILCVISFPVAAVCRFNYFRFLRFFREEILVCIATTSSEIVLPRLIDKLEQLGCDRSIAGVVLPAGLTFNLTGTGPYLVMVICFLGQAVGKPLSVAQQFELYVILNLTARSAVELPAPRSWSWSAR